MQKNKTIIFIFIFITLVVFLVIYFSLITKPKDTEEIIDTGETNFFQDLIDFGKQNNGDTNTEEQEKTSIFDIFKKDEEEAFVDVENLSIRKISSMPVAGYGVYLKEVFEYVPPPIQNQANTIDSTEKPTPPKTEYISYVKYTEKRTGNIFQNTLNEENERRFSEKIIPNIEESFFLNNTNSVLMRFLRDDQKTIATFLGQTREDVLGQDFSNLTEVNGTFLPENILQTNVSPDSKSLFYLVKTQNGSSGSIVSNSGQNKIQVFGSPFSEWVTQWPKENLITFTTKASGLVPGYMYSVNPQNKAFNKILGNINGLTTLTSKDGEQVLFSNNTASLRIYNTENKETYSLNTNTLPEKCVWSNDNENIYCMVPKNINRGYVYPDSWYQGETSFNDDLWKINTVNKTKVKIMEMVNEENTEEIDGFNLGLDKDESFLFFVNKKDHHLWMAKLK